MDQTQKTPPTNVVSSSYPSQQEGFIPLDFSSPVQKQQNLKLNKSNRHHHQETPYFRNNQNRKNYYQNNNRNRDYQQNNFRQNDGNNKFGRYSDQGNNYCRGSFQQNNRNNFHNNRGRRESGGHYQGKNVDISQYSHPTMLEDPWKELVERHNAMRGDNNSNDGILDETKSEKTNSPRSSTDE